MSVWIGFAILIIFIAAAILTPSPDALSQILMAIPLMFLYEVSIFVARFARRKKPAPEETEAPEDGMPEEKPEEKKEKNP